MDSNNKIIRKKEFAEIIQSKILSGELKPGDKLPSERELSEKMNFSRGSINQGILDLERLGFLKVIPRQGTFVADYINLSSPDTLSAIMSYDSGLIDKSLFSDLMDLRILIEKESVRLACQNRTYANLQKLGLATAQLFSEKSEQLVEAIYLYHLNLTIISGNSAYVLVFRSFEKMIRGLIAKHYSDSSELNQILPLYSELSAAIMNGDEQKACNTVTEILNKASQYIKNISK